MFFVVATEIEFYLYGSKDRELPAFWQEVRGLCASEAIAIYKIEKEKGIEQHEIALAHTRDIAKIIRDTERLKQIVAECAQQHGMQADFAPKPLTDEPGNGLHIHVHLEDDSGKNLYFKNDERMSEALAHSIAGLLATLQDNLSIFIPTEAGKARLVPGSNAPTTVSWGANNRTVAVRLPDKAHDNKHIEHRVAGADADVGQVVEAVLLGIRHGLAHKLMPPPQIYGDASLAQYGLEKIT